MFSGSPPPEKPYMHTERRSAAASSALAVRARRSPGVLRKGCHIGRRFQREIEVAERVPLAVAGGADAGVVVLQVHGLLHAPPRSRRTEVSRPARARYSSTPSAPMS